MKFQKKSILYFACLVCISSILLMACTSTEAQDVKSVILDAIESPVVASIKAMKFEGTNYTLGELVDASLGSPTYEYFNPAEDGNKYVSIKGNITYDEVPVVATLQYKEVGVDKFEFYTLTFNDVPQNMLVTGAFLNFLIESFENENGEVSKANVPLTNEESQEESFETYINSKYGFKIDYPASWGIPEESDSGDGAVLFYDTHFDVRAYASYLVIEPDFETYINENYQGWEVTPLDIKGLESALKLEFFGGESYQFSIVLFYDDTIYTYNVVQMLPLEVMSESEEEIYLKTEALLQKMIESFEILK